MDERESDGGATRRIVVGVDGSPSSMRALEWAAREAADTGAVLHILSAWLYPAMLIPIASDELSSYPAAGADHARAAAARAAEIDSSVVMETDVREMPADQALVEASRQADLVVVGRRGLGGLRGLLLGSVSQQCAEHALCPVVVVPPDLHA